MTRQTMIHQNAAPVRIAARGRVTYIKQHKNPDHTRREAAHALVLEFDNAVEMRRYAEQLEQTSWTRD